MPDAGLLNIDSRIKYLEHIIIIKKAYSLNRAGFFYISSITHPDSNVPHFYSKSTDTVFPNTLIIESLIFIVSFKLADIGNAK